MKVVCIIITSLFIQTIISSQSEYAYFRLFTKHDYTFQINNAKIISGSYCVYGDRDKHNTTYEINQLYFDFRKDAKFGATGRQGAAMGTEGSFEIHTYDNRYISMVVFSCPWSGTNTLNVITNPEMAGKYTCALLNKIPTGGAIKNVDIRCLKVFN